MHREVVVAREIARTENKLLKKGHARIRGACVYSTDREWRDLSETISYQITSRRDLFPFFLVGLVLIRVSDLQRPAAPVLAWDPGVAHLIPQPVLLQACLLH